MSGLKIVIPGYCTDETLSRRPDDPVLINGSLLLVTPSHDLKPWSPGVPLHGGTVPNLAETEARALIASGDLSPKFFLSGDLNDGVRGKIERTGKGGLHVIVSQSVDMTGNHGLDIELPDAIMQYLVDNSGHNYYFSQWRKLTRAALITSPDAAKTLAYIAKDNSGTGYLMLTHTSSQLRPASSDQLGTRNAKGLNALGTNYVNVAGKSNDLAPSIASYPSGAGKRSIAQAGVIPVQNTYSPIRKALQSWVFYRFYIEDLTVSGRSYAEVDAIDYALWQQQVESPGGKYYGDTHTDPATLP